MFAPVLTDFFITNLTTELILAVKELCDFQFGEGYFSVECLNKTILQKEKHFARVAIDRKSGEVIGFCLSYLHTAKELTDLIKIDPYQFPNIFSCDEEIGLIKAVVVKENYKRCGIGNALIKNSIEILSNRESNIIYSVGWRSKKGIGIGGILQNHKFKAILEVPDYWKEDSLEKRYKCADCGEPPCHCSAVLFLRTKQSKSNQDSHDKSETF